MDCHYLFSCWRPSIDIIYFHSIKHKTQSKHTFVWTLVQIEPTVFDVHVTFFRMSGRLKPQQKVWKAMTTDKDWGRDLPKARCRSDVLPLVRHCVNGMSNIIIIWPFTKVFYILLPSTPPPKGVKFYVVTQKNKRTLIFSGAFYVFIVHLWSHDLEKSSFANNFRGFLTFKFYPIQTFVEVPPMNQTGKNSFKRPREIRRKGRISKYYGHKRLRPESVQSL
jgi:hypothetical protein